MSEHAEGAPEGRLVGSRDGARGAALVRSSASGGHRARRSLRSTLAHPQVRFGLLVLVPALAWYAVLVIGPMAAGLVMAFLRFNPLKPENTAFVGLDNFARMVAIPKFGDAVMNTVWLAVLQFAFVLPLSLAVAVGLVSVWRGRHVYQAIVFLPFVVSLIAVSLLFKFLTDTDVGTFNRMLREVGLAGVPWLTSGDTALATVAAILSWKTFGFYTLLLTAGLLAIPREMYDLAAVDGAGRIARFTRITLPLLGHSLALVAVLLTINSLEIYAATVVLPLNPGGPGTSTYSLNLLLVDEALRQQRYGIGSSIAVIQLLAVLAISVAQLRLLRPKWEY